MRKRIQPVILCGGTGTRLWPISRKAYPKQFVPLLKNQSLLQQTLQRIASPSSRRHFYDHGYEVAKKPICIGSELHKFQIQDDADKSEIEIESILEPVSKNTAAAMAVIANFKAKEASDFLVFCPADHYIQDTNQYLESLVKGFDSIGEGDIITFGVKPYFASTAYGYLEVDTARQNDGVFPVAQFVEKPREEEASKLIQKQNIFWNAGSFMMSVRTLTSALKVYCSGIYDSAKLALEKSSESGNGLLLDEESFSACESESIDYAVLEHYENLKLVELSCDWSDVGSWNSLAKLFPKDKDYNSSNSDETFFFNSEDTFVYSSAFRPIVSVGLKNLIVVDTSDALLISDKNYSESIKNVVRELETRSIPQAQHHRKVNRPWGTFDSIDAGDRFKVKRISVKPGGRLSLQKHEKRAEHWVVVRGKAKVTKGDTIFELNENESTYIPIGVIHRLENAGKTELEIIEVQTGTYFGEDDIFRYEDEYGRKK